MRKGEGDEKRPSLFSDLERVEEGITAYWVGLKVGKVLNVEFIGAVGSLF